MLRRYILTNETYTFINLNAMIKEYNRAQLLELINSMGNVIREPLTEASVFKKHFEKIEIHNLCFDLELELDINISNKEVSRLLIVQDLIELIISKQV